METGVRPSPSVEAGLLMANSARGSRRSHSSVRAWAKARGVSRMTPLARSTRMAWVLWWYAEPTMRVEPVPWTRPKHAPDLSLSRP